MQATRLVKRFVAGVALVALVVTGCTSSTGSTAPSSKPASEVPATAAPTSATSASAAASTGCSTSGEPVTLTFWKPSWGIDEQYLAPLFKEFEAANPGVTVEYLFHPWEGLAERYATAFQGDSPPDVFYLPDLFYPRYAAAGYLAELDTLFPEDVAALQPEFMDQWWAPGNFNGHQYGIPYVHVGVTIAYNKDLFDAASVAYPPAVNSPDLSGWTWDKFVETGKALTDTAAGKWGFGWAANWPGDSEVMLYPYIKQVGDNITAADGKSVGFDNPEGLKAFEFMNDLANTYGFVPDGGMNGSFQDLFINGTAAMAPFDVYQVVGLVNDHPELNIGITPYPQGPGTELLDGRGMHANVGFLYQAAKSKSPECAFALIQFLTTKKNSEAYINAVGLFGARKDYEMAIENPKGQELAVQILDAANKYGFAYDIGPKQIDIRSILVAEVQNMLTKTKTPEEAWKSAVEQMNAALAK